MARITCAALFYYLSTRPTLQKDSPPGRVGPGHVPSGLEPDKLFIRSAKRARGHRLLSFLRQRSLDIPMAGLATSAHLGAHEAVCAVAFIRTGVAAIGPMLSDVHDIPSVLLHEFVFPGG